MAAPADELKESVSTEADDRRMKVAISARILGMLGLVQGTAGHVSARVPGADEMWIRCRGGDEYGLMFTGLHNVRRVDFDGTGAGLGPEHASPDETPIHGEIYRARPDVQAVVHAHPYYALLCGVTELDFRPIFGAFDPSALDIVLRGVPVFPRAVTVTDKSLAAQMLASMGDRDVLLMRGHGITVTGRSVEAATSLAIRFDRLAQIMWDVATSGRRAANIGKEDIERFDRRGQRREDRSPTGWRALPGVDQWGWKHYVRLLQVNGIGLPDDAG